MDCPRGARLGHRLLRARGTSWEDNGCDTAWADVAVGVLCARWSTTMRNGRWFQAAQSIVGRSEVKAFYNAMSSSVY